MDNLTNNTKNEEQASSELRYRRLFEAAQDGILLIDFTTGVILDVNKFLTDMLDYSKSDLLKKHLWEVGAFRDIAASKDNFTTFSENIHLPLFTKGRNSF